MRRNRADGGAIGTAAAVFAGLAMLFAFAAIIVAGQAWSRSNDAKSRVVKLASGGILGDRVRVTLQEYSMTPLPAEVKAGTVHMTVVNKGSITHELVLVRAPSPTTLPITAVATPDRSVGSVNEEAISESTKMGETGEVAVGTSKTLTAKLGPGIYVMFCNIDNKAPDGSVTNHFRQGMSATLFVQ
jgi:hypothetical protein